MPTSATPRDPAALQCLHVRYAESRDPKLRAKLVDEYSHVVRSVARRFARRGESFEDLVQVGFVGLLQALERYDPARGYPFMAFAVPTMAGELKRHFRDRRWRIRVTRDLKDRYLDVREARERLAQSLGRIPTLADIGAELGLAADDVAEAMEAGSTFSMASLDAPSGPAGRPYPCASRERGYDLVEDSLYVRALVAQLPATQQQILALPFAGDLTQSEIGQRVGMGQMQVSRTLGRALSSLRKATANSCRSASA